MVGISSLKECLHIHQLVLNIIIAIMDILNRINFGYDGLIRVISIFNHHIEFEISAFDKFTNKWINVSFVADDILEYKIEQPQKISNEVISDAILIRKVDDVIWFSLIPYSEEIENIIELRESNIYCICKNISWNILPYRE